MADAQGASNNERLLAAARSDNEEMVLEVFDAGGFDINHQDGQGNTALHYAALHGSSGVLEYILTHEDCDVDPINYTDKQTPLHLAVRLDDPDVRRQVVESLLDAGADTTIKDKYSSTALDYVKNDTVITALFRRAELQAAIHINDIADGDDDGEYDDDDEEEED
jgi:ankyrin repeat protein